MITMQTRRIQTTLQQRTSKSGAFTQKGLNNDKRNTLEKLYVVDGRSVMGMFSLNLTAPVTIEYDSEDDKAIEQFEKEIAEFLH